MQVGKYANEKTAIEEIMVTKENAEIREREREGILKFCIPRSLTDARNICIRNRYKPAQLKNKMLNLDWSCCPENRVCSSHPDEITVC